MRCLLIFVPPGQHLAAKEEVAEYKLHRNEPDDPEYRKFLNRLLRPLSQHLAPASEGLDFGSGPGPTLSVMFTELGHRMTIYDPYFSPAPHVFEKQYDFSTASEVVEHLRRPESDLNRLWAGLRPGGWLGIMTKLALGETAFARWHYKNDPTHIIFFSRATFEWLAENWQARLIFVGRDVVLIQKPRGRLNPM
jgi:hypothetical protein